MSGFKGGPMMAQTGAQAYQPTTGTLFCAPLDQTAVSAPVVAEGTDAESFDVIVLGPQEPQLWFGSGEQGAIGPDVRFKKPASPDRKEDVPEPTSQKLRQAVDPELAALWDNRSDDVFDVP